MTEDAQKAKERLLELNREQIKEAELALQKFCDERNVNIVPVIQIVPGQAPSAFLTIQLREK